MKSSFSCSTCLKNGGKYGILSTRATRFCRKHVARVSLDDLYVFRQTGIFALCRAPQLANTPASCSKQAARATPEGLRSLQRSTGPFAYRSLCPLSVTTAKSISEVKPSNKRDAHHFSMNGQI